jgi:hypothetical protein
LHIHRLRRFERAREQHGGRDRPIGEGEHQDVPEAAGLAGGGFHVALSYERHQ